MIEFELATPRKWSELFPTVLPIRLLKAKSKPRTSAPSISQQQNIIYMLNRTFLFEGK